MVSGRIFAGVWVTALVAAVVVGAVLAVRLMTAKHPVPVTKMQITARDVRIDGVAVSRIDRGVFLPEGLTQGVPMGVFQALADKGESTRAAGVALDVAATQATGVVRLALAAAGQAEFVSFVVDADDPGCAGQARFMSGVAAFHAEPRKDSLDHLVTVRADGSLEFDGTATPDAATLVERLEPFTRFTPDVRTRLLVAGSVPWRDTLGWLCRLQSAGGEVELVDLADDLM